MTASESFYLEYDELAGLPDTAWFIDKLIPLGGVSLLFAPPNLGKSLMALDMSVRVAQGRDWGGRETRPSDVLYIATEGARPAVRDRVSAWEELNVPMDPGLNKIIWYTRDIRILPRSGSEHELVQVIQGAMDRGYWPEFVVIDTLNYALDGEENDNSHMGEVAKQLSGLKNLEWVDADGVVTPYNPTVLVVHHTPKDNPKSARGAGALEGAVDSSLFIEPAMNGTKPIDRLIEVTNKKNRYASKGSSWTFKIRDDEHDGLQRGAVLEYVSEAERRVVAPTATENAEDFIIMQLSHGPKGTTELNNLAKDAGLGVNACGKVVKDMEAAGKIMKANRNAPWQIAGIEPDLSGL